jgi:cell division transport system permease protein
VMKLVGSPNWFIQMPFVLEAVFAGLIGAIFAFISLVCAKHFLLDGSMSTLSKVFPPIEWRVVLMELPILAGISALVTSVAGWITLRFYVRV